MTYLRVCRVALAQRRHHGIQLCPVSRVHAQRIRLHGVWVTGV